MNDKGKYIEENINLIKNLIEKETPKIQISRMLGIKQDTLNRHLKRLGINYAGNQNRVGQPHYEQRTLASEYFGTEKPIQSSLLKQKLINEGIKESKCERCGLSEWMGKPIPLELHHKNGNHYDNNLENLEILCSNCHMQAHNCSNPQKKSELNTELAAKLLSKEKTLNEPKRQKVKRNKYKNKEHIERYCINCGKVLKSEQKNYCSQECAHEYVSKRPPYIDFIENIKTFSRNKSALGRFYNVSDKTIDKWMRIYKI